MPDKTSSRISKREKTKKPPSLFRLSIKEDLRLQDSVVSVRSSQNIPPQVLDFFKMDPTTRRVLSLEESLFQSQVLMHEIDEGVRILARMKKYAEANMIADFSSEIHLSSRLDLLRRLMEDPAIAELDPEKVRGLKIRNNQWGLAKARHDYLIAIGATSPGVGYKKNNEDALILMPEQQVFALADGMGGHIGGNLASCIAVDFFEYAILHRLPLEDAIVFANDAILLRTRSDPKMKSRPAMGSTFAALQIEAGGEARVAYVGDTKTLLIRKGEIILQTEDHTQGQKLLREGTIKASQAFELNHILNRCLGLDSLSALRDVTCLHFAVEPGDRILLVTDGVTDNFFDEDFRLSELAELVSKPSLDQAANNIIKACESRMKKDHLENGRVVKHDNFSLLIVEHE